MRRRVSGVAGSFGRGVAFLVFVFAAASSVTATDLFDEINEDFKKHPGATEGSDGSFFNIESGLKWDKVEDPSMTFKGGKNAQIMPDADTQREALESVFSAARLAGAKPEEVAAYFGVDFAGVPGFPDDEVHPINVRATDEGSERAADFSADEEFMDREFKRMDKELNEKGNYLSPGLRRLMISTDGKDAAVVDAKDAKAKPAKTVTESAEEKVKSQGLEMDNKAKAQGLEMAAEYIGNLGKKKRRKRRSERDAMDAGDFDAVLEEAGRGRRWRRRRWDDDFSRGITGDAVMDAENFDDALDEEISKKKKELVDNAFNHEDSDDVGGADEAKTAVGGDAAGILKAAKAGNFEAVGDNAAVRKKYVHEEHWYKPPNPTVR